MRGFRTTVVLLLAGACIAVWVPGGAQGGPGATAKTVFQLSLPDSGQVVLAKLALTVKAKPGKAVPKRISLKLALQGALPSSVAVIVGPTQVVKVSKGKAQVVTYVGIVNKRGAAAARVLAARRTPRSGTTIPFLFLAGPALPAAVKARTTAALAISGLLRVGTCAGCKPLSGAQQKAACAQVNATSPWGQSAHTLGGASVLGTISSQDALSAWWSYGCGDVVQKYLLPYIETTGKDPHCATFHIGFGTGSFADDNQLVLGGCRVPVSGFGLLSPNDSWNTPVNRWSNYAVVGTGVFYSGPCQKTWSTGFGVGDPAFSCPLSRPMVVGSNQLFTVAFGPSQIAGTQFVAGLSDADGLDWYQLGTVGQ